MLALIALFGLKPWEADSVEPRLELPRFEAAVGESIALPSGRGAFVAAAMAAPPGATQAQAAGRSSEAESPSIAVAVAPARAVAVAEVPYSPAPAPESGAGNEVPSDEATTVEASPEGTSLPVRTPASPDGGGPGPVTSGGPVLESCDGDEYVITISLAPDAEEGEEASVEIVLQRFNEDGSVDELQLVGDLLDAENLAVQLSSEGNCVIVEASEPEGTGSDEGSDADPAGEAIPELDAP